MLANTRLQTLGDARSLRPMPRLVTASSLALAALLCAASPARAHLFISEGDVAIIGIHTNPAAGPVSFEFVTLTTFTPGEVIIFTDRGWLASAAFRAGEGQTFWDVDRLTTPGTVISRSGTTGISLEAGADQIFAVIGPIAPDGTPTDTVLYGLNLGGPWAADATSTTTSALPVSLAGYEVALGSFLDCSYAGPTIGTRTGLLALIGDPTNWVCDDTARTTAPTSFTVEAAQGESCTADADCTGSFFCAYGVCCDTECRRDEAWHCSACDFGAGDPRTGTCGPAPTIYLCRTGSGPCDPMDSCDGVSLECPPNVMLGPDVVCRESTGGCDPAEVCPGDSPTCPADARAPEGSVCRPSRGICDPEERCGPGIACPDDVVVDEGTDCDDGLACTMSSQCSDGLCAGPIPVECDDSDSCTADSCDDSGGCANAPIDGCCHEDADCDDGDPCSADTCGADGWCVIGGSTCLDAGAPAADAGAEPPPPTGCGCRVDGSSPRRSVLLLALLALVGLRRRRLVERP